MKPVQLRVEKLIDGGIGLAFLQGKAAFVPLALPGELVHATIIRDRRDYVQTQVLEVIEPSPKRIKPACSYYGFCGGCNLMHLGYEDQLFAKIKIFTDTLYRIGGVSIADVPIHPSTPWAYRNRVQLHYVQSTVGSWGYRKRGGDEIIPVSNCLVACKEIQDFLRTPWQCTDVKRLVVIGVHDKAFVLGKDKISLHIMGKDFLCHTDAFLQSNVGLLPRLISRLTSDVKSVGMKGKEESILADLYCGVGMYTYFLAPFFATVIGIEQNRSAYNCALANNINSQVRLYNTSVEAWLSENKANAKFKNLVVVVNPPREGVGKNVIDNLLKLQPRAIVYISCMAASFARDCKLLQQAGYSMPVIELYDYYPQTSHIETYAVFTRE